RRARHPTRPCTPPAAFPLTRKRLRRDMVRYGGWSAGLRTQIMDLLVPGGIPPGGDPPRKEQQRMKLATSSSRGVIWRANPRGPQKLNRKDGRRERGDWWIRWACPHGHLHRALAGPKSVATEEVQRKRLERPCPRHQARKVNHLLADVITEYLTAA